jgi:hypothetical protein
MAARKKLQEQPKRAMTEPSGGRLKSATSGNIPWRNVRGELGVGRGMALLTPSDVADLATTARSLYVTVAGDVRFKGLDGNTVTVTVPANFILPVAVNRLFATGTTATSIFAIW